MSFLCVLAIALLSLLHPARAAQNERVVPGLSGQTPRTLTVAQDETGDFRSIQEAVEAAGPGDTVLIARGAYHEDVTVHSKERLTIKGESRDAVHLHGQGRFGVFYIGKWPYGATKIEVSGMTIHEHGGLAFGIFNGRDIVLRDLEIKGSLFGQQVRHVRIEQCRIGGSETTGVQFADSQATLVGNLIHDNDHGVTVAGTSNVRLERNVITRSLFEAVLVRDRARVTLLRNTLAKNGGGVAFLDQSSGRVSGNIVGFNKVGFRVGTTARASFTHNGVYNSERNYLMVGSPDGPAAELHDTDVVADPRFVDLPADDFRLRPDTPLVHIGGFPFLGALAPTSQADAGSLRAP